VFGLCQSVKFLLEPQAEICRQLKLQKLTDSTNCTPATTIQKLVLWPLKRKSTILDEPAQIKVLGRFAENPSLFFCQETN